MAFWMPIEVLSENALCLVRRTFPISSGISMDTVEHTHQKLHNGIKSTPYCWYWLMVWSLIFKTQLIRLWKLQISLYPLLLLVWVVLTLRQWIHLMLTTSLCNQMSHVYTLQETLSNSLPLETAEQIPPCLPSKYCKRYPINWFLISNPKASYLIHQTQCSNSRRWFRTH